MVPLPPAWWRPCLARTLCSLWLTALGLVLLTGCGLLEARRQSAAFHDATVLVGRISVPGDAGSAVVVAALDARSGQVVHRTWLHESGGYELIVPRGDYRIAACADRNRNGACDPGEAAARLGDGRIVTASGTGLIAMLDLVLEGPPVPGLPATPPPGPLHSTQVGAVLDLASPAASAQAGVEGYWTPMDFFQRQGGNLYALGPHDPARIPVVLVHGAVGSAQDWRWFIEHLDRRYEPWLFVYPSGASVDSMANLLYWKLFNAQLRHQPERLVIVAHSMGGLVARRFLTRHGALFPQITDCITLSTPWGGEATAELGVQHSPGVVPSWRDLRPEGPFLRSLFDQPLPPQVRHTLLFSHRGGYSLLRPNHDGTVTLASQLRSTAQAQAVKVRGFDEDHMSILASPAALAEVQGAIEAGDPRLDSKATASGHVALDLRWTDERPVGTPLLLLTPVGAEDTREPPDVARRRLVVVDAEAAANRLGPVPAGWYDAALLVAGQRSLPATRRLHVGTGQVTAVAWELQPDGQLTGVIGQAGSALDHPAGAALGSPTPPAITRLTLTGAGQRRVVHPAAVAPADTFAAMVAGEDAAFNGWFWFGRLPAGDYELVVESPGRAPHLSRHRVDPGRSGELRPLLLPPAGGAADTSAHGS